MLIENKLIFSCYAMVKSGVFISGNYLRRPGRQNKLKPTDHQAALVTRHTNCSTDFFLSASRKE